MVDSRPFHRFTDRLAGKQPDDVLLTGVPDHLLRPLQEWVESAITSETFGHAYLKQLPEAVHVALRLDHYTGLAYAARLAMCVDDELLNVIDALLQLNPEYGDQIGPRAIDRLDLLLRHGRSAYRVADDHQGLTARVDPTSEAAFREAARSAEPDAAALLRQAWYHAYKPTPDATSSYREAVRAVEQAIIPIVTPNDKKATLGTVIGHMRSTATCWEIVLVDKNDVAGSIEPFVSLIEQLWTGQRSRHGGSSTSRDQTPEEAQAAVHLAVLAVQLLASGAIRRAPTP